MSSQQILTEALDLPDFVVKAYLGDLTDADLLRRPAPGMNHLAWQIGHLITSERNLMEAVSPGSMPALPEGFAEKHSKANDQNDDPSAFLTKEGYLALYATIRSATRAAIAKLTEADLEKPGPEPTRNFLPTVSSVISMQGSHWMMHAGQWAVVRRQLGRPPLF